MGQVDRIDVFAVFREKVVCGNISTDLLVRGNMSINIFNPYSAAQINISAYQVLSKHLLDLFLDAFLENRVLKYKVPLVHLDTISQYGDLNILFASNNSLAGKQILSEEAGIGFFTKMTIKSDPYFTTGVLVLLELEDHKINHHYGYIKEKIATYQILTRSLFAPYLPIYNTS